MVIFIQVQARDDLWKRERAGRKEGERKEMRDGGMEKEEGSKEVRREREGGRGSTGGKEGGWQGRKGG